VGALEKQKEEARSQALQAILLAIEHRAAPGSNPLQQAEQQDKNNKPSSR